MFGLQASRDAPGCPSIPDGYHCDVRQGAPTAPDGSVGAAPACACATASMAQRWQPRQMSQVHLEQSTDKIACVHCHWAWSLPGRMGYELEERLEGTPGATAMPSRSPRRRAPARVAPGGFREDAVVTLCDARVHIDQRGLEA